MGKARIVSGGTDGQYQAVIEYDTQRLDDRIAFIDQTLTDMTQELLDLELARNAARDTRDNAISARDAVIRDFNSGTATLEDIQAAQKEIYPTIKPFLDAERKFKEARLKRLSLLKEKSFLESEKPPSSAVSLWCADLTESLDPDAIVPTIEVNGEAQSVIITPQFDARAWLGATDGQLQPVFSSGYSATWYNWALLPGWQKWKPTYRVGVITSMNLDRCDVALDEALSSQQSLDINQAPLLSNVSIDYMDCDAGAFDTGDRVVVQFTDQDWSKPVVIGFESNPKPCAVSDFATIPRSDVAPNGWGLPATDGSGNPINGGLGTVGGSSPWITMRTAGYNVTRFINSIEHGNLYWKPKNILLPILSWVGPENGYHTSATFLSTFGVGGPAQQGFGRDVYAARKKIATCASNHQVLGSALRNQGAGFRLFVALRSNADSSLRIDYADVSDLDFTVAVTTWFSIFPPDNNPYTSGGVHFSDGTMAFNQAATKCCWVYSGVAYEWIIDSNAVSDLISLNQPGPETPVPPYPFNRSYSFDEYVLDPCGSGEQWLKTFGVTETSSQNASGIIDRSVSVVCVDYLNDSIVAMLRKTESKFEEVHQYTSTRTHTRDTTCLAQFPQVVDSLSLTRNTKTIFGSYFDIQGSSSTLQSIREFDISNSTGDLRNANESESEARQIMKDRVDGAFATVVEAQTRRETYVRHTDLKSGVMVVSYGETIYAGLDGSGSRTWRQQRRHSLLANGQEYTFWTESFGTHPQGDILDSNGNVIIKDPREGAFTFQIASDRYSSKVFASIVRESDGATLINYLTGSDPVSVTGVYGANPRFDPVTIL